MINMLPKMLFLNIGWMKWYGGPRADDRTRGNFKWLKGKDHGHECYNFVAKGGFCRGHHPGSSRININALGAEHKAEKVDGILVVWFSKDPRNKKAVIIGWHPNATVYREWQTIPGEDGFTLYGEHVSFKTAAKGDGCVLLTESQRQFPIPNHSQMAGGYGQSAIWYGGNDNFRNCVWEFISEHQKIKSRNQSGVGHNSDTEQRLLIEKIAIEAAFQYYSSTAGGSRTVVSRELECLGWDLEAKGSMDTLLVEVKGSAQLTVSVELTPNKYTQMLMRQSTWTLFVVTGCLSSSPKHHEFRYMHDLDQWESAEGIVLSVKEKVGAIITAA